MKHIVIDARLYGTKHTGIGRYTKNLLIHLTKLPDFKKYRFTLIIHQNQQKEIKQDLKNNFNLIITNISHYSLTEQLKLPILLYKLKPNLVHFTHFNKPLLYFGKSVITIHDLIKHFSKGKDTTTKNPFLYWPKYLAYLLITNINIKNNSIIVPSNFWRQYLIKNFKIPPIKIITTHEAVDEVFFKKTQSRVRRGPMGSNSNYLLYTGNLYPHKNIKVIFQALTKLPNLKLKIISAHNIFTKRAKKLAKKLNMSKQVQFLGHIDDHRFKKLYQNALCLIHPSFMEGFSLTGLEAMALSCPVISSNSSCLPEIYQNSVLYFNPNKTDELITQIKKLQSSQKLRQQLISRGHKQVAKYSWKKCAHQTLNFYTKLLK
ncbi:glycosyltransferase family 4 protein [Patescibacteria group bacterium]|nr:glycosyltransferase family 4 protein [Patescibacteria group bacterium]